MNENTTSRLDKILENSSTQQEAERFINNYCNIEKLPFYKYFERYIIENNILIKDIVAKSNINKNYVYQILNGRKKS